MKPPSASPEGGTSRQISCWACRHTLDVPKTNNHWATEFKCGWCGAIINMKPVSPKARHGLLLTSNSATRTRHCVNCLACSCQAMTVGFVITLLLAIMTVGYFGLLPNVFHDVHSLFWNELITIFLSLNISVNYAMAIFKKSHSKNAVLPHVDGETVPRGIFDNYRYCVPCQSVKTPGVHHCSTCNACIDDMDHHCPFIGNCVGKKNLHNFLLFLFWTAIGAVYAMFVCVLAIIGAWPVITKRPHRRRHFSTWSMASAFKDTLPWWILAAFYMLVVCLTGTIGVVILLSTQLQQIQRGQTYIESLKNGKTEARPESAFVRLSHVFGGKNPLIWLFPFFFPRRRPYETVECKVH